MSNVITFLSASGGVGKTAVSAALASEFARAGESALLIDLNSGNRAADLFLGLEGRILFDLSDVLAATSESSSQLIIMHHTADKLGFIAAPFNDDELDAAAFAAFIKRMRHTYNWIILDTPTGYSGTAAAALSCSDKSFIIMTPENLAARGAERLLSRMREDERDKPDIIINRAIPEYMRSGVQLQPSMVVTMLDARIVSVIRENDGIYRACMNGTIAGLDEHSDEFAVFRQLAGRVRSGAAPKSFGLKKRFLQSTVDIEEIL
jgi:septum formation inhibitor-activating ATPase MinD